MPFVPSTKKGRFVPANQQPTYQNEKGLLRSTAEAAIDSPLLPMAGAITGGIMGAGLASIPLAGLGAAGGESLRQLVARGMGMNSPQTSSEAAKKIGIEGVVGSAGQALGLGAEKALAPIIKPAATAVGRSLAGGVEKLSGIPAESTINAFTKPLAILTAPTKKTVSKAYAASEFPEMTKSLDDILSEGTSSHAGKVKQGANAISSYVEKGIEQPSKILQGRKALDKQLAVLENQIDISKGPGRSALLQDKKAKLDLRATFNRALDAMAPKLRDADALASKNLEIAPFRNLTLPGKINVLSPEGVLRAVPGLPTAIGATVSTAGAITKAAGSEVTQKSAEQAIAQILKPLGTDKAKEYLKKALKDSDGDITKARKLAEQRAKKDGFDTSAK